MYVLAMTLVYITCKDGKEAEKVSIHLLNKRLIACANIFPVRSLFWWNGRIEKTAENAVVAKTIGKNLKKLESEVRKIHSYDVPCIIKINATASKEFEEWLGKEIK
ncbi:divalent-cation tolerance protein CutA [Candidatus Woesearchaeota archaeon]|nr:divalent-cation tolerance protein CutA [Candidatus Woesearchaeota archaeon]